MPRSWLLSVRRFHTYLSLFFAPLLVLFIVTGLWQTLLDGDALDGGAWWQDQMQNLSTVHEDSYYPRAGEADPSTAAFRWLVTALCVGLLVTVGLGVGLAWKGNRRKWPVGLALFLGVAVPVLVLWLA